MPSVVMLGGQLNRAADPAPSATPSGIAVFALPVTLLTTALALVMAARVPLEGVIMRILLLAISAAYRLKPSVVMPFGLLNEVAVPAPSAAPAATGVFAAPVRLV